MSSWVIYNYATMKKSYYLGLVGYLALLVLAAVYYKERIVFSDAAFYLFNIVKDGDFAIFHSRFIAVITECFPLLGVKLQLPLDIIIMLYSVGFVVFFLVCYLVAGFGFKNYGFALVILLVNMLFVTDTFYWMLSELIQAIILMCLFFSILSTRTFGKLSLPTIVITLVFLPILVFAHPLMVFPFGFGIAFMILHQDKYISVKTLVFLMVMFIVVYIMKALFATDVYDTGATQGLKNFVTLFPDYLNQYATRHFVKNWTIKYYWIPVSLAAITFLYVNHKQWLKLILVWVALGGYALLINVSYPTDYTPDFYFENLYTPLAFILALPLVLDVFPLLEKRNLATVTVGLIVLSFIIRIPLAGEPYVTRLNWERQFLKKHSNEKLIVDKSTVPMDTLMMEWSTPYEFWLLSTTEDERTASLIIAENASVLEWATRSQTQVLFTWGFFQYAELPQRYFKYHDSTTMYRVVK